MNLKERLVMVGCIGKRGRPGIIKTRIGPSVAKERCKHEKCYGLG